MLSVYLITWIFYENSLCSTFFLGIRICFQLLIILHSKVNPNWYDQHIFNVTQINTVTVADLDSTAATQDTDEPELDGQILAENRKGGDIFHESSPICPQKRHSAGQKDLWMEPPNKMPHTNQHDESDDEESAAVLNIIRIMLDSTPHCLRFPLRL